MFNLSASTAPEAYNMVVALGPVDIRQALGSTRVPTLLLHRTGDQWVDVHTSRYMAKRIPDARLVELPGDDHLPCFSDQDAVVALTQEFLTGALPVPDPDRMLATVLFTDIVDSTRLATELGNRRWHRSLEQHNAVVRSNLARFRGKEVKTTGDGFLVTFDGPARAIRAAHAIQAELAEHGLAVRVGLHTGEVELVGDGTVALSDHPVRLPPLRRSKTTDHGHGRVVRPFLGPSGRALRVSCRSFGDVFRSEGAEVLLTPMQAPRANAFAERWVRTVRTECLDGLLIVSRGHLEQALRVYVRHSSDHRPHRALMLQPPDQPGGLTVVGKEQQQSASTRPARRSPP
jgi:hypothetical protein